MDTLERVSVGVSGLAQERVSGSILEDGLVEEQKLSVASRYVVSAL